MKKSVAVVGANGKIGMDVLRKLQKTDWQTIALVRKPQDLPANETITDWMNNPQAFDAIGNSEIVIHLAGNLNVPEERMIEANIKTTEMIANAMKKGTTRRVIYLSYLGANPNSSNLFLKTKGQAEQMLQNTGRETVIFRCPAIINIPQRPDNTVKAYTADKNGVVTLPGKGEQIHRAVFRDDVVNAIVNAIAHGSPGTYDMVGPDRFELDELVRLFNKPDVKLRHTPAWLIRILSRFLPNLNPTMVDLALRDADGDPTIAAKEFNLSMTSLKTIWR